MGIVSIITWIVLGFISGLLAKIILPGKDPGGLIVTTLIGIAGSFVGGWIGAQLGFGGAVGGISIASIVTAVAGALVLLIAYRFIKNKV